MKERCVASLIRSEKLLDGKGRDSVVGGYKSAVMIRIHAILQQ